MRASLARHGRRLLIGPACACAPACAPYAPPALRRRTPDALRPAAASRRSFFNALFREPPREVRQPEYEPGWMDIMVWRARVLGRVRPPGARKVLDAWTKLMHSKIRRRVPLNSTQALQCRRLLEHLLEAPGRPLSPVDVALARRVLLETEPEERSRNHVDFARALHAAWASMAEPRGHAFQWGCLVRSLGRYGAAVEALQMLCSKWGDAAYVAEAAYFSKEDGLVEAVARGLAAEGRERELVELAERALAHGALYGSGLQAVVVGFFARRDRVPETQRWFARPAGHGRPPAEAYRAVAWFAMRNGLKDWAMPHFLELGQSRPAAEYWDVLLQAALLVVKGLGEVEALMSHMVARKGVLAPDEDTLNGLLAVAVDLGDPALGEQIMALGAAKGLAPNGETCLAMLRMRLATGDLAGARAAFERVRHYEAWRDESKPRLLDDYRRLLNRYLLALCGEAVPDFGLVRTLLEAVDEDQVRLGPETVAALCLRFLENDQLFDVMDLLSAHSFLFSEPQREAVQGALIGFCLDAATSTARAWAAYQLLSQFFQETSLERRTVLMRAFFGRRRPDMASQVFGHMRQHRNQAFRPTADTYVDCLEGFARRPDPEGLGLVHNMLRTDTAVQPTTRLSTALMLAYTACGKPATALELWADITQSREGPSYATLEAVFWALERKAGGGDRAREIWARIERMDLEVPPRVYVAYVGAVAGSGAADDVRRLLAGMPAVVGSGPDAMTLAVAHNALPGQRLQEEFRAWAEKEYPGTWAELGKVGRRLNEYQLCQFKIERVMKA